MFIYCLTQTPVYNNNVAQYPRVLVNEVPLYIVSNRAHVKFIIIMFTKVLCCIYFPVRER